jgi:hypothetical protein
MTDFDDRVLRAALAPARRLVATDDEVRRVMERAHQGGRTRRPHSSAVAVLAALVLLASGAYAVPATRAAVDDVAALFADWATGTEDEEPGRALAAADVAPAWVRASGGRLIAKTDGIPLYVTRTKSDEGTLLGFSLGGEGTSIAGFDTVEGWRDQFSDHAVVILGALPARSSDKGERFPLFGVTARGVERVELRYASGPPLVADGLDGGFVLMADATRPLREVVAYAANGDQLERANAQTYFAP